MADQPTRDADDRDTLSSVPFLSAADARRRAGRVRNALASIPWEPPPEWDRHSPTAATDPGAPIGYAEYVAAQGQQAQAETKDGDASTPPVLGPHEEDWLVWVRAGGYKLLARRRWAQREARPEDEPEAVDLDALPALEDITRESLMRGLREELGDEEFEKRRRFFEAEADAFCL